MLATAPLTKPTMLFVGVTTRHSSINAIFPRWAERLGLGACELRGIDFPVGTEPAAFRAALAEMKRHPLVLGGLVTTHKVAVAAAGREQFDVVDPLSAALGEVSSLFKRAGQLHARAVDPWTSGDALNRFLPRQHWATGAEAFVLGAGGAGVALAWHLAQGRPREDRPRRLHLADRDVVRLRHAQALHAQWRDAPELVCHRIADARAADDGVAALPPGSLVVNATGAGKDTPGSPLSATAQFPLHGLAWDFNYRGELEFLRQAEAQRRARSLHVEDGWTYFLHGWIRAIGDVFARELPTSGPLFDELGELAAAAR